MAENTPDEGPGTGRYAAYDNDLERFVGGVHDSKAKATKAAKDRSVERFDVREV